MRKVVGAVFFLFAINFTLLWKAPDVEERLGRIKPVVLKWPQKEMPQQLEDLISRLIEACDIVDEIFWHQTWSKAVELREELRKLATSQDWKPYFEYYLINYGPFDRYAGMATFIGDFKNPSGANFYPEDLTREELLEYLKEHPEEEELLLSPYTVVRRKGGKLFAVPYHEEYRNLIVKLADMLKEAADVCEEPSLKRYLAVRAEELLQDGPSGSYTKSHRLWVDLTGPLEIAIGPEGFGEDRLFNKKAAFTAFLYWVDRKSTQEFRKLFEMLEELQKHLPLNERTSVQKPFSLSNVKIAYEIYNAGEARAGVQRTAFILPSHQDILKLHKSKKVIFKNVLKAKFDYLLIPASREILDERKTLSPSFDMFYLHVLMHEISHALGPSFVSGSNMPVSVALKDLYEVFEEMKSDVLAAHNIVNYFILQKKQYSYEKIKSYLSCYLLVLFRGLALGVKSTRGRACLLQLNFLLDEGVFRVDPQTGKFYYKEKLFPEAIKKLSKFLLELEEGGSYKNAKKFLTKYDKITKQVKIMMEKLKDMPIDLKFNWERDKKERMEVR